jgi:Fe-S-cluster containining protein
MRRPKNTPFAASLPDEPALKDLAGYENHELCSQCKGQCCRHVPGATHPVDWKNQNVLTRALIAKLYSIDANKNTHNLEINLDKVYYVRPAVAYTCHTPEVIDLSWGGPCIFLGGEGCQLLLARRPTECRMMEPREHLYGRGAQHCWGHVSRKQTILAWLPYQRVLEKVAARAIACNARHEQVRDAARI